MPVANKSLAKSLMAAAILFTGATAKAAAGDYPCQLDVDLGCSEATDMLNDTSGFLTDSWALTGGFVTGPSYYGPYLGPVIGAPVLRSPGLVTGIFNGNNSLTNSVIGNNTRLPTSGPFNGSARKGSSFGPVIR